MEMCHTRSISVILSASTLKHNKCVWHTKTMCWIVFRAWCWRGWATSFDCTYALVSICFADFLRILLWSPGGRCADRLPCSWAGNTRRHVNNLKICECSPVRFIFTTKNSNFLWFGKSQHICVWYTPFLQVLFFYEHSQVFPAASGFASASQQTSACEAQ